MPRTALVVAIVIASLVAGTHSAVAEDKAAEITKDAQAALASLYAKVPKAKELGAKADAILVFPKVTKAGLGIGGQHGKGALIKRGKTVAYYDNNGRLLRPAGRGANLRLRDVLHEPRRDATARQGERFRGWRRPDRRRNGRGQGQEHDHHDDEGRHLRLHLRPERADGGDRDPGQQGHEDRPQVGYVLAESAERSTSP